MRQLFALLALLILARTGLAADQAVIDRGKAIAIAADCAACHRSADESATPFVGGYAVQSPMGPIYASNITPSKLFGIGLYSEQQFADALRQGVRRDGTRLYPAMPYTSYTGMTDEDISALYAYLTAGVAAVDRPAPETRLAFPFNQRWALSLWNVLFLKPPTADDMKERGRYLVDVLGHCGECHTPRNFFMASKGRNYLAGASVGGWYAPNITSNTAIGIGGWSEEQIVQYLKTGHVEKLAQAAGGMAEAVEHSLQYFPDTDLAAIAAYLKKVPSQGPLSAKKPDTAAGKPAAISVVEPGGLDKPGSYMPATSTDGAFLYEQACAACHQVNGAGTADLYYPDLSRDTAVEAGTSDNLVMAILDGVDRRVANGHAFMPGFRHDLNDAQAASLANYVLSQFGGFAASITVQHVADLRAGGQKPGLVKLVQAAPALLIGLLAVLAALVGLSVARRR